MDFVVGALLMLATLTVLAAIRVHRTASWRSLVMILVATGSPKACLEFLRFCERMS